MMILMTSGTFSKQFCYKYLMPLPLLGGYFPRTLKDLATPWFSDYISEKIKLKIWLSESLISLVIYVGDIMLFIS